MKKRISKLQIEQITSVIATGISVDLSPYISLYNKEIGKSVLKVLDEAWCKTYLTITNEEKSPTVEDFLSLSIELPKVEGWVSLERYYVVFINILINQYVDIRINDLKILNKIPSKSSEFLYSKVYGSMTGIQFIKWIIQNSVRKSLEIQLMKASGIEINDNKGQND